MRIRLFGIDSPELQQEYRRAKACVPCGKDAREALISVISKHSLICEARGKSFDRVVARYAAGDIDLGLAMIEAGYAVVSERYIRIRDPIRARYLDAEASAKKTFEEYGVWSSQSLKSGAAIGLRCSVNLHE